jgi:hypothetical protein
MNPLNYEALAVIESGVILDDGSGSPGRLQEVGIIHIDYESGNDLYDGGIVCVYSVMLCVQVCLALVNILQGDSAVSLSIGKAQVRIVPRRLCGLTFDRESTSTCSKDWIDATICELGTFSTGVACLQDCVHRVGNVHLSNY